MWSLMHSNNEWRADYRLHTDDGITPINQANFTFEYIQKHNVTLKTLQSPFPCNGINGRGHIVVAPCAFECLSVCVHSDEKPQISSLLSSRMTTTSTFIMY